MAGLGRGQRCTSALTSSPAAVETTLQSIQAASQASSPAQQWSPASDLPNGSMYPTAPPDQAAQTATVYHPTRQLEGHPNQQPGPTMEHTGQVYLTVKPSLRSHLIAKPCPLLCLNTVSQWHHQWQRAQPEALPHQR